MRIELRIENGHLVVRLLEDDSQGSTLLSEESIALDYLLDEMHTKKDKQLRAALASSESK